MPKALLTLCALLIIINSAHSGQNCTQVELNATTSSKHINIPTNTKQCITINNTSNQKTAILSNMLGSKINVANKNYQTSSAIVGETYYLFENSGPLTLSIQASSSISKQVKTIISTEQKAEIITFKNQAINFLLLGIILSITTFHMIYGALKRKASSIYLSLLTISSVAYFIFESSVNNLTLSKDEATLYINLLSFISCTIGLALLHSLIKNNHKASIFISFGLSGSLLIGLLTALPIEIYRSIIVLIILHVLTNITLACRHQKNIIWYLLGSITPSLISISIVLISEVLPTIASYNLILLSICLQCLFISKAIFAETEKNNNLAQEPAINNNNKEDYLAFCKDTLIPQLAANIQLIKHNRPAISNSLCTTSITQLQLVELFLLANNNQHEDHENFENKLFLALKNNRDCVAYNQHSNGIKTLYLKSSESTQTAITEILKKSSAQTSKTTITHSILSNGHIFISAQNIETEEPSNILEDTADYWLLVDDNINLLNILKCQCDSFEQKTLTATSPDLALDTFLAHTLNISHILIDWNLLHETAYSTIKNIYQIIQKHRLPDISIHIMSAQKLYSAAYSEFPLVEIIEKPITIEKLIKIRNN